LTTNMQMSLAFEESPKDEQFQQVEA
jgi:hypothetical protein